MLQSEVLPGTSTPRVMQEDGAISGMTISSQTGASPRRQRGVRSACWRGMRSAFVLALVCAALVGCTGEQFQKGYILPEGALEQIPIGASQDQVLIVMGTPSTVATLSGEVFYYISQRPDRPVASMNQRLHAQRVFSSLFYTNSQVLLLAHC